MSKLLEFMIMARVPCTDDNEDEVVEAVNAATEAWCNELNAESIVLLDISYVEKKRPPKRPQRTRGGGAR